MRIHRLLHHLATQHMLPWTQPFGYDSKLSDMGVPVVPPSIEASFRVDIFVDPTLDGSESVVCCSCSKVVDLDLEGKRGGRESAWKVEER